MNIAVTNNNMQIKKHITNITGCVINLSAFCMALKKKRNNLKQHFRCFSFNYILYEIGVLGEEVFLLPFFISAY